MSVEAHSKVRSFKITAFIILGLNFRKLKAEYGLSMNLVCLFCAIGVRFVKKDMGLHGDSWVFIRWLW